MKKARATHWNAEKARAKSFRRRSKNILGRVPNRASMEKITEAHVVVAGGAAWVEARAGLAFRGRGSLVHAVTLLVNEDTKR